MQIGVMISIVFQFNVLKYFSKKNEGMEKYDENKIFDSCYLFLVQISERFQVYYWELVLLLKFRVSRYFLG